MSVLKWKTVEDGDLHRVIRAETKDHVYNVRNELDYITLVIAKLAPQRWPGDNHVAHITPHETPHLTYGAAIAFAQNHAQTGSVDYTLTIHPPETVTASIDGRNVNFLSKP